MAQTRSFEQLREYFVNPTDPKAAEDLALLGAEAIRAMARIYASGGELCQIPADLNVNSDLLRVTNELLKEESKTRRFDSKFMGQIKTQGNIGTILAKLIAGYMSTNTIIKEGGPSEHSMEHEVIDWMKSIFGYDQDGSSGNVVSGGTLANLAVLWAVRQRALNKEHERTRRSMRALERDMRLVVLESNMGHYSVEKSCSIVGLDCVKVPSVGYKTNIGIMERAIKKINSAGGTVAAIIGLAGETETGMVDDLVGLADLAQKYDVHFHADAAYGGAYVLSSEGYRFRGIERADSITVDPHKLFYCSYPSAVVLFKDKNIHALIQRNPARYLGDSSAIGGVLGDPALRMFGFAARVEGSMGADGVMMPWVVKRLFGNDGMKVLLDHTLELTRYAYERVSRSELLRPLHVPETNTLLIGLATDYMIDRWYRLKWRREISTRLTSRQMEVALHQKLINQTQGDVDGLGYYVSTNDGVDPWDGAVSNSRTAFRMVPTHPYTKIADVEMTISLLEESLKKYRGKDE